MDYIITKYSDSTIDWDRAIINEILDLSWDM
jgi:hypothetical protein